MSSVLLATAYFAPIQYYAKLLMFDNVYIEAYEHYSKQSYRNRCNIVTANGMLPLTIPVQRGSTPKQLIRDVRIDNQSRWKAIHKRAIESAYQSAPFYMYYVDDIFGILNKDFTFLIDLNTALHHEISTLTCIEKIPAHTNGYKQADAGFVDCTDSIHPKKDTSENDKLFKAEPYYQVFGQRFGFIPNASIIDVLFNCGPETVDVVRQSTQY